MPPSFWPQRLLLPPLALSTLRLTWTHQVCPCLRAFARAVPAAWNALPPNFLCGSFPLSLWSRIRCVPSHTLTPIHVHTFSLPLLPTFLLSNPLLCLLFFHSIHKSPDNACFTYFCYHLPPPNTFPQRISDPKWVGQRFCDFIVPYCVSKAWSEPVVDGQCIFVERIKISIPDNLWFHF